MGHRCLEKFFREITIYQLKTVKFQSGMQTQLKQPCVMPHMQMSDEHSSYPVEGMSLLQKGYLQATAHLESLLIFALLSHSCTLNMQLASCSFHLWHRNISVDSTNASSYDDLKIVC